MKEQTGQHTYRRASLPQSSRYTQRYTVDDVATDEDQFYDTRLPTSTRRYRSTQQSVTRQQPRDVVIYEGTYYYRQSPQRQPAAPTQRQSLLPLTEVVTEEISP